MTVGPVLPVAPATATFLIGADILMFQIGISRYNNAALYLVFFDIELITLGSLHNPFKLCFPDWLNAR